MCVGGKSFCDVYGAGRGSNHTPNSIKVFGLFPAASSCSPVAGGEGKTGARYHVEFVQQSFQCATLYTFICMYMSTYVYEYAYVCLYLCLSMYTYMYVDVHVYACSYTCVFMHERVKEKGRQNENY